MTMSPRTGLRSSPRAVAVAALLTVAAVARPGGTQPAPAARVDAAPIKEAVAALAADVARWGGTVGVSVIDVQSGEALMSMSEHRPFNPASNAKLLTAAAALRILGGQHRFLTGLYGRIDGDTVESLVLRGDGDPSLRTADLWAMAMELRASGVRKVGAIVVDQSYFDDQYVPPAFEQQPNEWAAFRAPVAPVSLNENTVIVSVRATREGHDALVEIEPPGFVDALGTVTTSRKQDAEKVALGLSPLGARLGARLGGSVPEGGRTVRVAKRVDDPRLLAGYALRAMLQMAGVKAPREPRLGGEKVKELLVAHRSASVGEMLGALGKESDNFYAEMLFKAIGARAKGRPASADAAADAVRLAMEGLGAFEAGMVIRNGSGLFDADRMTPAATTALLRAMARDTTAGPEYVSQLSVGGVDGTLRHRFRDWADVHTVRAKTGTLDAVAAISGYVVGPPGRDTLAFSILVNGISGKVGQARPAMDRIVEVTAREVWKGTPGR
jgi:D-alanyl-D-alanine carboxypeptidase/D-alanyl-D-alanine-endopeptidase (penicillin-binding protein 4)